MVSSFNTTDQNRDVIPGCGPMLHTKTASVSVGVDLQEQKQSFDNNSMEPLCGLRRLAVRNGKRFGGADAVADWMEEIKKTWALGASSTLNLARVVSAAKNRLQRQYGQWSQLWRSEHKMPVSKRTADMLAVIGGQMGGLDSQTSANLPRGWNSLYCLTRLDRHTLERLIREGVVHPKLTLAKPKNW